MEQPQHKRKGNNPTDRDYADRSQNNKKSVSPTNSGYKDTNMERLSVAPSQSARASSTSLSSPAKASVKEGSADDQTLPFSSSSASSVVPNTPAVDEATLTWPLDEASKHVRDKGSVSEHASHPGHKNNETQQDHHPPHHPHTPHKTHHAHSVHMTHAKILTPLSIVLLVLASLIVIANQVQISQLSSALGAPSLLRISSGLVGQGDLGDVNLDAIKSTSHSIAAVFPLDKVSTQQDALAVMFPQGIPDYGEALGVSYDDPVKSLSILANMYPSLRAEVQKNNPEAFSRFISLATKPLGISCEFCCGIGPVGVDKSGNSLCGCQHNPALLSIALYLTAYTDYTQAEILREVMRWKTIFFPKNMIELGLSVAGQDPSSLAELPGMVGGC